MVSERLMPCLAAGVLVLAGCAKDLDLDPPVAAGALVVAQFDPTHPVPVLRLVPSPTSLAENEDGTINKERALPPACQRPTPAQCLEFVSGWPATVPATLFFSGSLDESTVKDGVKLFEVRGIGVHDVDYDFVIRERPQPNPACMSGDNGSIPPQTYTAADIPPGIELILTPKSGQFAEGRRHILTVISDEEGGLRAASGGIVEPSALFSLLNVPGGPSQPVQADGTIVNALLRSQVQANLSRQLFPEKLSPSDLAPSEQEQLGAAVQAAGAQLYQLWGFFNQLSGNLVLAGKLENPGRLVLVNTWVVGKPDRALDFDPANGKVPFPNVELLTRASPDTGQLSVSIPVAPSDPPSAVALKQGLATLNGFSNTAPMLVTASVNVEASTLTGNVVMVPLNDQGMPAGSPVDLVLTASEKTDLAPATITIQPARPLAQGQRYVVAITRGVKDAVGKDLVPAQTFEFLKLDPPFIDAGGDVLDAIEPALQCATVATEGRLATDTEVQGLATQLENDLAHPRWTAAFRALETLSTPIPRTNVLLAWTYQTQSVTTVVDLARDQLLPGVWDALDPRPRVLGPAEIEVTGSSTIAEFMGIARNICVPICEAGAMQPDVAPGACAERDANGRITSVSPAVRGHLICQVAIQVTTGNLARLARYRFKSYRATRGNPFVAGTFTPASLMTPEVIDLPFWIVEGRGTPPAGGRPAAIFLHGLGSQKEAGFLIANSLAGANAQGGWATVLIDQPFHGARASDLTRASSAGEIPCTDANGLPNIDPASVVCAEDGTCQGGCDGVRDASATGFLVSNLFAARDNFRQSTLDVLTLLHTIEREGAAGGALEFLDGSRIALIGQSLGGIQTAHVAAHAPQLEAAVINAGGGGITRIILDTIPQVSAPLFASLVAAGVCQPIDAENPSAGCQATTAFGQFVVLAQTVLDPGDPLGVSIGLGPGLGADRVLIQISQPDPVVPNASSLALANAYGFGVDGSDARLQVFDFSQLPLATQGGGCHGWLLGPICGIDLADILCNTLGAQAQAADFVESGGTFIAPKRRDSVAGCN